jgi:anti-sigma regulatory factor (Ser/Thr protein kinase)
MFAVYVWWLSVTAEEKRQQGGPGNSSELAGFAALEQEFDSGTLYALRAAVAAHAAAAGLSRHRVYDVTAVAHELAANAVLHGAGHGRLQLWADDKYLYCQVSDDGRAGSADGAAGLNGRAAWPVDHGHGLWLAGQIADDVGIGHGPEGTTATVRFLLNPE